MMLSIINSNRVHLVLLFLLFQFAISTKLSMLPAAELFDILWSLQQLYNRFLALSFRFVPQSLNQDVFLV